MTRDKTSKTDTGKIEKILAALPSAPGVYKMINNEGGVLYVGKAKNLRNRVKSYFQRTDQLDARKQSMVNQIVDIAYTVVASDLEAIMLETNLIKELKPKYNVLMKDDKNFVYVRITQDEEFPRVTITRKALKDGAYYIGPKTASHKIKKTLDTIRKVLPFRHCGLNIACTDFDVTVTNKVIKYPCLYYYIRRCAAPCIGKITPGEYKGIIDKLKHFLNGKPNEIIGELKQEMVHLAEQKKFEKAAIIRDKIKTLDEMFEKQRISDPSRPDTDIVHFVIEHGKAFACIFQVREGRIIGQENIILIVGDYPDTGEIAAGLIRDYYEQTSNLPEEILIPEFIEEQELAETWLTHKRGKKVRIIWPVQGEKNKLLELALANAKSFALQHKAKWMREEVAPRQSREDLARILNLPKSPKRIECYDISHRGGTSTTASMVVFINGTSAPHEYRRFHLRTIPHGKPDDYASMEEVLTRRLKYLVQHAYRFVKPTKKLWTELQKIFEQESAAHNLDNIDFKNAETKNTDIKQENFLCMLDKKKLVGFVRIAHATPSHPEIRSLWIHPDYRKQQLGHTLLYELIRRNKEKKYYIYIKPELTDYYANFGFQEAKTIPPELTSRITAADETNGDHGMLMIVETMHVIAHYKKFTAKPDLIVLDGGRGQLNKGIAVLTTLKLNIPIIAIAKEEEELYVPDQEHTIKLPDDAPALHLIQQLRDEAHRFAITYSGAMHNKTLITSQLDEIPGIGTASKQKLLNHFGSLDRIKNATLDELARIIGKKAAVLLKQSLQNEQTSVR